MGQLNFFGYPQYANWIQASAASNGSLTFYPIQLPDNLSFKAVNFAVGHSSGTFTLSVGLYSLNESTLSLINSISGTRNSNAENDRWFAMIATSANQNISAGPWWLGVLLSTSGASNFSFYGNSTSIILGNNAFPGGFIGGRMTESTAALPGTYATSNLDITGSDALYYPIILLTA